MSLFQELIGNFLQAPILFFLMGILAILIKSDLRIPAEIAKFLSIYLLVNIGLRGGQELAQQGLDFMSFKMILVCSLFAFFMPMLFFVYLKNKLDIYNSGAIAATYGSISLVTFASALTYIENLNIDYGGYMVAGMAFMEAFAIISGLILIRMNDGDKTNNSITKIIKESVSSGSVFLLLGSFFIGFLTAESSAMQLKPFIYDIFKGMLCLYLLDMGIYTAQRFGQIGKSASFLSFTAIIFPICSALFSILISYFIGLSQGDAYLFSILAASASYIAVPAAMRISAPKANIGLVIPMALGISFPLNIVLGVPIYFNIVERLWS